MRNLRNLLSQNNFLLLYGIIAAIATGALLSAYYVEYVLGHKPCVLCVYQRYPYFALIAISAFAMIFRKIASKITILLIICVIVNIILSAYHIGVEEGIFEGTAQCNGVGLPKLNGKENLEDLKSIIYNTPVISCKAPTFFIAGLSMAYWNLFFNIGLLCFILLIIIKGRHNEKLQ